jgi:uncharacterized protein
VHWPAANLPLLVPLVAGGLVGAIAGQALAPRLSDQRLRQGFAALLTGAQALLRQHSSISSPHAVPQQR